MLCLLYALVRKSALRHSWHNTVQIVFFASDLCTQQGKVQPDHSSLWMFGKNISLNKQVQNRTPLYTIVHSSLIPRVYTGQNLARHCMAWVHDTDAMLCLAMVSACLYMYTAMLIFCSRMSSGTGLIYKRAWQHDVSMYELFILIKHWRKARRHSRCVCVCAHAQVCMHVCVCMCVCVSEVMLRTRSLERLLQAFISREPNMIWKWNVHQSISLAEPPKAVDTNGCKLWVTDLLTLPHTLGIHVLTASITCCIILFELLISLKWTHI